MEANFMNIKQADCLRVSAEVLKHSDEKFEEAEMLAKAGRYGTATSLLIISNEELLKSLILFLDGHGFRFRSVKGMKSIFQNHKLRYLLSMVLSMSSILMEDLLKYLMAAYNNPSLIRKWQFGSDEFNNWAGRYLMRKTIQAREEILFFAKFDKTRQKGLYSDYSGGILETTEHEYSAFYNKVSRIRSLFKDVAKMFYDGDQEIKTSVQETKESLNKDNSYLALENLLCKINKPGVDPYQALISSLNEFWTDVKDPNTKKFVEGLDRYRGHEKIKNSVS
jgi:AbiV family abortive infection protein